MPVAAPPPSRSISASPPKAMARGSRCSRSSARSTLASGRSGGACRAKPRRISASSPALPTREREAGGRNTTTGLFAGANWSNGGWSLAADARLDRWTMANGHLIERDLTGALLTDTRFANRSGWEASGRVAAGRRCSDQLALRAAAYRGWRLPTLNELYRPFRAGADATAANAALDPERLYGVEAGTRLDPGRRRKTLRHRLCQPAQKRRRQRLARVRTGQFPASRLRRRRRHLSPAPERHRDRQQGDRDRRHFLARPLARRAKLCPDRRAHRSRWRGCRARRQATRSGRAPQRLGLARLERRPPVARRHRASDRPPI